MGEHSKPGRYWDHRECRWVRHSPVPDVVVPEQAEAVPPAPPSVPVQPAATTVTGADVRSV